MSEELAMMTTPARAAVGEVELAARMLLMSLHVPAQRLQRDERGEGGGNSLITLIMVVAGVAAAIGLVALLVAAFKSRESGLNPGGTGGAPGGS